MDAEEEKKDSSSGEKACSSRESQVRQPGTSRESLKRPGNSRDNARKDKRDFDGDSRSSLSSEQYLSRTELKVRERKGETPHLGTKKMRVEKKTKKRKPGGRVQKRRKSKGRHKRRSMMHALKRARLPSVSSEDSRRSESPWPKCRYCGHRCCLQRYKQRAPRKIKCKRKKDGRRKKRPTKSLTRMLSECNQIGSRCAMLSPLFIKSSAAPPEQTPGQPQPHYCEITPQMIHDSLQELTMSREGVPSRAILCHIQSNYPVNPDVEEGMNELAEKLHIANLTGIVFALPDDHWRLTTVLEKRRKLDDRHVTLFWRMHADTMKPLDINCKSRLSRCDARTGWSQDSIE